MSEIVIEGLDAKRAEALKSAIPLCTGMPARRSVLFESEEAIRLALLRDGRIEAKIDSSSEPVRGPDDALRVRFHVEPGPAVTVSVEGTAKKERRALERQLTELWKESRFETETYPDAVKHLRDSLRDRGYFAAQVDLRVEPAGDAKRVRFIVDPGDLVEVEGVRIEGAVELPEARVREALETRPSGTVKSRYLRPAVVDSDRAAIASLYAREGYLRAKVDPARIRLATSGRSADVAFHVEEGPRFTISGIEADDKPGLIAGEVVTWSGLTAGQPFSAAALRDAETRIRAKLDESGYPDARINTRIVTEASAVLVHIDVTPGERRTVGSVAIVGATRTKDKIIRRELQLAPGDLVSREKLVASQQRLYRLGIFRNVRIDLVPEAGATGLDTLRVRVEEAKPLQLSVATGYDTEAGPRGSFSLSHTNVGGRNRSLALQGAASSIYQRAQIVARDPRLFSRNLQALFSVGWENQENVGYTQDIRSTAFRVEQKLRAGVKGFIRYNFQRVDLEDVEDEIAVTEDKLENVRLGDVGYLIGRDRRDDPFLPTTGGYMASEVRVFAQPFLSESTFVKGTFQGSTIHTFKSGWQRASGIRLGLEVPWGDTDAAPITERFFAGGDSTLRGFSRDTAGPQENGVPIGGQALLIYNEEWRYPIWRALKGELFYDVGNVWSRASDASVGDLRHVLGTGVRFDTAIGPIRLEYGHKLNRKEGESAGEYFLSIGSAF